jgi:RING finger protein 113A
MFRKPKKAAKKAGNRRKSREEENDDDGDEGDEETRIELQEARKRAKVSVGGRRPSSVDASDDGQPALLHQFEAKNDASISHKDLATSTNEYHPTDMAKKDPTRNKFLAGPIRAPTNIRTTCRFDYQPDICKDYKDTGFCGFGDTCIYLHDRGDSMSGWQLEQKWEQEQAKKKQDQERQMEAFMNNENGKINAEDEEDVDTSTDDGLPFACFLCRKAFEDPIVTPCGHYFCQGCLHSYNQEGNDSTCPICKKDTHGVMNQPTKLLGKKRKLVGRNATWQEYMDQARK